MMLFSSKTGLHVFWRLFSEVCTIFSVDAMLFLRPHLWKPFQISTRLLLCTFFSDHKKFCPKCRLLWARLMKSHFFDPKIFSIFLKIFFIHGCIALYMIGRCVNGQTQCIWWCTDPTWQNNFFMLTDVSICQCGIERPEHTKRRFNRLFGSFWGVFSPVAVPYLGAYIVLSHA